MMSSSTSRTPRVSVVIPAYNRSSLLRESLDSVLAQTFYNLEVIVVDDGSTDDTAEMISSYSDPRLRYVAQPHGGVSKARNTGIRAALGEFIAFQDSDDIWLPQKLERQMGLFDAHPEVGWVYCSISFFGCPAAEKLPHSLADRVPPQGDVLKEMFIEGCPMSTPATIVRRRCFDRIRGFDEQLSISEDSDVWYQLAARFKVACVTEPLVRCRREDWPNWRYAPRESLESKCIVKRRVLNECPRLLKECSRAELYRGYYRFLFQLARLHLQQRDGILARQVLAQVDAKGNFPRVQLYIAGTRFPRLFMACVRLNGSIKGCLLRHLNRRNNPCPA